MNEHDISTPMLTPHSQPDNEGARAAQIAMQIEIDSNRRKLEKLQHDKHAGVAQEASAPVRAPVLHKGRVHLCAVPAVRKDIFNVKEAAAALRDAASAAAAADPDAKHQAALSAVLKSAFDIM